MVESHQSVRQEMADERVLAAAAGEEAAAAGPPGAGSRQRGMPRILRTTASVLKTFQIVGMGIVVALMLLTVAHVIGRYVFDFPMLGVVEVSGLMVIALVFFAAPYDFYIDRHIAVDVIVRRLPAKGALIVNCLTYFVTLVVVTLAFIWTIKTGQKQSTSGAITDILRIPLYPFYFVVAFGWLLSLISILARLVRFFVDPEACESPQAQPADKAVEQ
jgi:TRAP-type transport system small permease protein